MGCGASADSLYAVHPPEQLHRPIPKDYARSPPITPSKKRREGSEHTSRAGSDHNSRGGSSCGSRGGSDYGSRASTPSAPLPFAFRRCSNVESAESDSPRPELSQAEITEMLVTHSRCPLLHVPHPPPCCSQYTVTELWHPD